MSDLRPAASKRPRGKYSRLICLGCRDRRIRCELPSEVEIPSPGEVRTIQTPCYRCKRLGIACIVRQTILGRPNLENSSGVTESSRHAQSGDIVSRIVIELPSRTVARNRPVAAQNAKQVFNCPSIPQASLRFQDDLSVRQRDSIGRTGDALLLHVPQSTETVFIIRAIDTLRREKVEDEWFRHLPAHVGRTQALDLSIKAIVVACSHARGVQKVTSGDCYQALSLALNAVQASIKQSHGKPDDDILASTALLAPFEGVVKKHGILTRLHVEGLAAILVARPTTYPVTQLARDILDFHACESAIMSCIQGTPSPFERLSSEYFGSNDSDQARLKAIGNELFTRIPRLVGLVRSLRVQPPPHDQLLLNTLNLLKSLQTLQDPQAEGRLLANINVSPSSSFDAISSLRESLQFTAVKDFEALGYYWQSRLCLLRLEWRLHTLSVLSTAQAGSTNEAEISLQPSLASELDEILRLEKNILMSLEYAGTLPLRKHDRLFAHAMVVVWGVKSDIPMTFSHDRDNEGLACVSDLLLRKVNTALAAKPELCAKDMSVAADIFVGGQPKGRFAQLYGL